VLVKWVVVERQNLSGRYVALRGVSYATEAEAKQHIIDNFREGYRKKFHVESRTVKPDADENRMHCQCCSRAILANLGTIAHHGYERPGHGWQTGSCMGAKELPFEVDRSALGRMIKFLRDRLARAEEHRAAIKAEKLPIVFNYESQLIGPSRFQQFGRWQKWPVVKHSFDVSRESFEAFKAGPGSNSSYGIYDFDAYKKRHVEGLTSSIKNLRVHIAEEESRFSAWKQTHERKSGQWVALKKEKA